MSQQGYDALLGKWFVWSTTRKAWCGSASGFTKNIDEAEQYGFGHAVALCIGNKLAKQSAGGFLDVTIITPEFSMVPVAVRDRYKPAHEER